MNHSIFTVSLLGMSVTSRSHNIYFMICTFFTQLFSSFLNMRRYHLNLICKDMF